MMRKYPHAITQKCGKCGSIFTCKGTGWKLTKDGRCPYAYTGCHCEQCHHGESRTEGCEEVIDEFEVVQFT
jgi:hypothetical protein